MGIAHHRYGLVALLCLSIGQAQVVINEVLPIPPAGEPEWVELYNSGQTAAELEGWWIADLRTAVRLPPLRIPPQGYALLTRDTAALREARHLPAGIVLVELRVPTLNNTSDAVVLRRPDSTVADSLFYSMRWGQSGRSLERRRPELPAWSPENLAPCEAPAGATPGEVNSITPVAYDCRLWELRLLDPATFSVRVENNGTQSQAASTCVLWVDADHDGSVSATELRWQQEVPALAPGQQWEFSIPAESVWHGLPEGWYTCGAAVTLAADLRRWNDTLRQRFYRSVTAPSLRFNEVLYEPLSGGAEFVELVNVGTDTLVLEGWKLHTWSLSQTEALSITAPLRVPPQGFAVIAWDSAIVRFYPQLQSHPGLFVGQRSLQLNNDGDILLVRDPNGLLIDSLPYSPQWHDPALSSSQRRGRSLEKLHPLLPSSEGTSWSSSAAPLGATPGEPNSIAVPEPGEGTLAATPNPLRLSGAERRYCVLSYRLPFRRAFVTARVFTEEGVLLRTLAHAVYSASEGYLRWDGANEHGERVPPGVYVVLMEAQEAGSARRYEAKAVLIVGY